MPYMHDMAFLAENISDNMAKTPDGFLICYGVRVSRTGIQYYDGGEMGLADKEGERIKVYRLEEDVFAKKSLQSLEGKPITDEHPQQGVKPDTATQLIRGHVSKVRPEGIYVTVDLMIMDADLIEKVESEPKA